MKAKNPVPTALVSTSICVMTLFQTRENRIFKNAAWLHPLSDPPAGKPLCREQDLKYMASLLSDLFITGKGSNLFVFGKPGTGKTVCVRYLLSEIQKHAEKVGVSVATVYVNAGRTRAPYYTMLEIVKGLGLNVPSSGWQMFRLKRAFEDALEKTSMVIAIDEVETLLLKEKEPLVYYLNRQPKTALILISNKIEDAAELPERALSTLQLKLVLLEPYTPQEAEAILKERVGKAFYPRVIQNDLIKFIAEISSKAGDIRLGFSIILSAGRIAEEHGKNFIETEDIADAAESEIRMKQIKDLLEKKSALERLRKRRR